MTESRRLMVIVPDALSAFAEKGELVTGYYNPGDLFHVTGTGLVE